MAFTSDKSRQGAAGVSTGYEIDNSLRFNDNDSAYLSKNFPSDGNRQKWTFSCWVKKNSLGINQRILTGMTTSANASRSFHLGFDTSDRLVIADWHDMQLYTDRKFRDCSAWYHIVLQYDTTQSTESSRINMWVNGEVYPLIENTAAAGAGWDGYPPQYHETIINSTLDQFIAVMKPAYSQYLDGYLAEVNFVDGQALTPSDFGETGDYGEWKPIAYTGTYGTNGFYLDFENSGSLGADASSNSNNWTPNNLAATDQMLDSPTNNFATLNPLYWNPIRSNTGTYSEGNLKESDIADCMAEGTIATTSGKWYYEVVTSGDNMFGVGVTNKWGGDNPGGNSYGVAIHQNGTWVGEGSGGDTTAQSHSDGDLISIAYDLTNNKIWMARNGVWSGNPSANTGGAVFQANTSNGQRVPAMRASNGSGEYTICNFGQDSSFAGNKTAQGNTDANGYGDFYYAPPTGYLALCTQNLPEPAVVPSEHFNTVLYTGAGSNNQAVTGVGFRPDLNWIKKRNNTSYHHLHDVTAGTQSGYYNYLSSNATLADQNDGPGYGVGFKSFDSDGFTIDDDSGAGGIGGSGDTFVAWNWKANGTGVSNTSGTITSTVSANVDAGFSIVSYTGNGTAGATIGHGLSSAPEMVIYKNRADVVNWITWHTAYGGGGYIQELNTTSAIKTTNTPFNGTAPNNTILTLGTNNATNGSTDNLIAYCFHSVDGYSKVGSYTGNSSTDGTFVYTGFRPAYVMLKSTVGTEEWWVYDSARETYNVMCKDLNPDSSAVEACQADTVDFVSNGFKLRVVSGARNQTGRVYIFIAFAETPFSKSNAR